jgi:hypothetical protein
MLVEQWGTGRTGIAADDGAVETASRKKHNASSATVFYKDCMA